MKTGEMIWAGYKIVLLAVAPTGLNWLTELLHKYYPAVKEFGIADSYFICTAVMLLALLAKLAFTGDLASIGSRSRPVAGIVMTTTAKEITEKDQGPKS